MKNETNLNDVERFNGVDVLKVMEMIKKPSTNFDRITASPEALAEFIGNILDTCSGDIDECDVCQLGKHCNPCDGFRKIALNWLNEEYKNE